MIRVAKYAVYATASLVIIAIAAPLLFWLGRPLREGRGEMVIDVTDLEIDSNDPGEDVDDYRGIL